MTVSGDIEVRLEPHNIEAEQALLGTVLLNNDVLDVIPGLDCGDFYDPVHRDLFHAIRDMAGQGRIASPVTVKDRFLDHEGLTELGGTDYLARLSGAALGAAAAPDYARVIADHARARKVIHLLEEARGRVGGGDNLEQTLADLQDHLLDATEAQTGPAAACSMAHAMGVAAQRMNDAFHGTKAPGIDLQIPELVDLIGPAIPGDMILLGGRPSMGKSAVAIEIARRCADQGIGVVYWCGEMSPEDNAERAMSAFAALKGTKVAYNLARQGKMHESQFKALLEAAREMEGLPFYFVESGIKDVRRLASEMRRHVRRLQRQRRDVLIVFDYLQMAEADARSRYEEVTKISATLKKLAVELRCVALTLAQLSRNVETRENKRPMLQDLRDSGQIEQDGNTIIFCYRDEYYLERIMPSSDDERYPEVFGALERARGRMELIVAKQRSGPLGTAVIGFDGATNSITSLADQQEEFEI